MQAGSKLAVALVACAGLFQAASAQTLKMRLELQDQKERYKYALGDNRNPNFSSKAPTYQAVPANGINIFFEDPAQTRKATYLYIRPNKTPKDIQVLELKPPIMRKFGEDFVIIDVGDKSNNIAYRVRYENDHNLVGLRQAVRK